MINDMTETTPQCALIRGRSVICRVIDAGKALIIEDGAVFQRDGIIEAIGSWEALSRQYPDAPVLGSARHVVMPGFVNSHHHVGLTPFQLGSPDLPLELWLGHRMRARAVDPRLDTLYSAFEMLASGVTTVQHLHGRVPMPLDHMCTVTGQVVDAYKEIGMRVSYSYGVRDQNRLAYEDDAAFTQRLPAHWQPAFRRWLETQTVPLVDSLAVFEHLYARHADDETVRIQLAPVNLHWCSDAALEQVGEYSRRYDVPMHMHLLETRYQQAYARKRTGGSPVSHLERLGLLGPRMTLGHGVWMTEADIDLLADSGTHLCSNASSNLRLRSGMAPVNHLRRRNVRVSLGIDEAGINEDRDMLQEMRLMLHLHRVPGMQPDAVPSACEVFRMATENGALTTGFGSRIGVLAPGKAADLVLMDWDRLSAPYLDPDTAVIDAVVRRAKPDTIDTVMVAGEVVVDRGRFTRVDQAAVMAELAAQLGRPPSAAERERKTLSEVVLPVLRAFYAEYCEDCHGRAPFYRHIQS